MKYLVDLVACGLSCEAIGQPRPLAESLLSSPSGV